MYNQKNHYFQQILMIQKFQKYHQMNHSNLMFHLNLQNLQIQLYHLIQLIPLILMYLMIQMFQKYHQMNHWFH